jgi:hypothetical protein
MFVNFAQRLGNGKITCSLGSTHPKLVTEGGTSFGFSATSEGFAPRPAKLFPVHYYQGRVLVLPVLPECNIIILAESRDELVGRTKHAIDIESV